MSGKSEPRLGAGDVVITIRDGAGTRDLVLRPTVGAVMALSRQDGGIAAAINQVSALNLDVIVRVIRLGIGEKEAARIPDLAEKVWQTGMTDRGGVTLRVLDYLQILANGGRPLEDESEARDDTPRPPARS